MSYTRGTAPASVPVPNADGYYWVRLARPRYVPNDGPMDQPCKDYRTWDDPVVTVELVRLHDGWTDWMGDDEGASIEHSRCRLIEVIARIEVPR